MKKKTLLVFLTLVSAPLLGSPAPARMCPNLARTINYVHTQTPAPASNAPNNAMAVTCKECGHMHACNAHTQNSTPMNNALSQSQRRTRYSFIPNSVLRVMGYSIPRTDN